MDFQVNITSGYDLHVKVVDFIRKFYPEAIIIPGLGELQIAKKTRTVAYKKGHKSGQPDLIIMNKNRISSGLAIEFKTPKGKGRLSANQKEFLDNLSENGFTVLVSHDYDEIIIEIVKHFSQLNGSNDMLL